MPSAKRFGDAGIERPRSRVVGLVRVEADGAAREIDVAPRQAQRLALAHALAREEAVEQSVRERHPNAPEQARILIGVEPRLGLLGAELRQPAAWQWVRLADPHREHGEAEHAMHDLPDVPARRAREA
ncbi:MAG: hypothetical protein R3B72_50155 [Polyangiaceae bacterium]